MRYLTPADMQLLDYIVSYEKAHLFPPTVREMGEGVGISSTSSIYMRLRKLQEFNKIRIGSNGRITVLGYQLVESDNEEAER